MRSRRRQKKFDCTVPKLIMRPKANCNCGVSRSKSGRDPLLPPSPVKKNSKTRQKQGSEPDNPPTLPERKTKGSLLIRSAPEARKKLTSSLSPKIMRHLTTGIKTDIFFLKKKNAVVLAKSTLYRAFGVKPVAKRLSSKLKQNSKRRSNTVQSNFYHLSSFLKQTTFESLFLQFSLCFV